MRIGAEVAQTHQRFAARVLDLDPRGRRFVRDEHLVVGSSPKRIIAGVCNSSLPIRPRALDRDPAAGAGILQRALGPRLESSIPWR